MPKNETTSTPSRMTVLHWAALVVALGLLNAALTFTNVWPTPKVRLSGDLSVELAVCVLGLVLAWRWVGAASGAMRRWLAILWVFLVAGRYAEVTVRALYGRDINIYWDLQLLPNVGAMFAVVANPWLTATVVTALILIPVLIYTPLRWSLGCIGDATNDLYARRALGAMASGVIFLSFCQALGARVPAPVRLSEPVIPSYVREFRELAYEITGAGLRDLGPPPTLHSDLSHVNGADVLLVFLESYGAISWDRPELSESLAPSRMHLATAIRETGRSVVSAFVESTTFAGESWLAHISLLSGTEVRDQGTNVRLMAQQRDTLVTIFGSQGYRTVAIMPGLLLDWPQGAFYGFDDIYDLARLDYQGPPFGWWDTNDQFAFARMDALEIEPQPRRPVFVFFPTITTHAPFTPAPPYQPDWTKVLTPNPYKTADLDHAWSEQPDWLNLGPSYVKGLAYAHATLSGYLRLRADRDFVLILIGDHQPSAFLTGENASWEVPVHVISSRRAVLDTLRQHRFHEGLDPKHPAVARMDTLLPILLEAFGDVEKP